MAKETERKFHITKIAAINPDSNCHVHISQGYLCENEKVVIRVRIMEGIGGFITIKSNTHTMTRDEYEFEIPVLIAQELLSQCTNIIDKVRYVVGIDDHHAWEVDIFNGDNEGLMIAEIEGEVENPEDYINLIGISVEAKEVTGDKRFYNANLASHPYKEWKREVL